MMRKPHSRDARTQSDGSVDVQSNTGAARKRTLPTLAYELSATTWVAKAEVRSYQKKEPR